MLPELGDSDREYDPLYITSSMNSGELVLSYLLFARARLNDIKNSIRM